MIMNNLKAVAVITLAVVATLVITFFNDAIEYSTLSTAFYSFFATLIVASTAVYYYVNKPSVLNTVLFTLLTASVSYVVGDITTYTIVLVMFDFDMMLTAAKASYYTLDSAAAIIIGTVAFIKLRNA